MRLFIGIPLADRAVAELSALVSRLRPIAGNLRWSAPESWHLTLQFLGPSSPEQLECLKKSLAELHSSLVRVELGELGSFERAGILFVDVAVTPELTALQQRVITATARCGFIAEARPFHPHITLARKSGNNRPGERGDKNLGHERRDMRGLIAAAGVCRFSSAAAHELLLYESHLGSAGSRYEVLARFPLGGHSG
jgi:RNA 2',3'-cyclic 3'-phosphodiesterase